MKKTRKFWPLLIFILVDLLIFKNFFFKNMLPIPGDLLLGAYYPWYDNKWGYPVHVPVKNPLPSDVISIIYPWREVGVSILKTGKLPLWDPTIMLGVPLLANFQSALLNPLNVLYFILSFPYAWSVQVVLQPI